MGILVNDLPSCIVGYYPLAVLERCFITITGMQYARIDSSLSAQTIESLKKSERFLLKKEKFQKYQYLMEEHDVNRVYRETFLDNNEIGKVHVSILINEKPTQSYAELAAAYSSDKKIPFIVGVIMLEDFRKAAGGIFYYTKTKNKCIYETEWIAPESNRPPPIKYRKLFNSNYQSSCDTNDNYVLATLKDYCFNKEMTTRVLGINNYIFRKTLERQNVLNEYGIPDKLKIEKILERTVLDMADLQSACEENSRRKQGTVCTGTVPPDKNISRDTEPGTVSDELLLSTYRSCNCDLEKTARILDLPYSYAYFHICKLTNRDIYVYSHEYCEDPAELEYEGIPIYDPKEEIEYDSNDFSDLDL